MVMNVSEGYAKASTPSIVLRQELQDMIRLESSV
jgi:hypothetical protein